MNQRNRAIKKFPQSTLVNSMFLTEQNRFPTKEWMLSTLCTGLKTRQTKELNYPPNGSLSQYLLQVRKKYWLLSHPVRMWRIHWVIKVKAKWLWRGRAELTCQWTRQRWRLGCRSVKWRKQTKHNFHGSCTCSWGSKFHTRLVWRHRVAAVYVPQEKCANFLHGKINRTLRHDWPLVLSMSSAKVSQPWRKPIETYTEKTESKASKLVEDLQVSSRIPLP